jgi:NAD(P)-dependent dehydrogenase (short-subunit alcohol dehydrogenase family)
VAPPVDVNLFGHVAMTQALLPTLIESRGTVVNVTSVGGKVAMAGYGAYAGSKFALEAVSDALRREVADFGVKVVVIEPGAVTTEMTGRLVIAAERITSGMTGEQRGRYDALMQAVIAQAQTFTRDGEGLPAEEVGRRGRACRARSRRANLRPWSCCKNQTSCSA